ncbi:MAG: CCA tRNA nucleotidyltransferase [Acidobacteria bacterium]|nr:CCA tRNA nucleotidyltransferase [Acidobacteriota bacterium]
MPDYIFMLESRLSPEQLRALSRVQEEAQAAGLNLYLVGGAVRDLMTGSPIRDLDFTLEGNPLRLARRLAGTEVRCLEVDERRHSAELQLADGVFLSLQMARNEFFRQPGRPPEVKAASILEDLRRRDFSVNAMGISLTPGSRGLLLDPTNGLADIENRELRILHNYSFLHDPMRLLRLVRFWSRLGFRPDDRTRGLFEVALERGYQENVEPGAVGREVEQITREENAVAVLKALAGHELLAVLHPMLQKRKPDYEGLAKLQKYLQQAAQAGYRVDPFYLVLHYLRRRLKGRAQAQLLRHLALKKAQTKPALGLEREVRGVLKLLSRNRKAGPRQIYHLLTPVPLEFLIFVLAEYSSKKRIQAKIYNYLFKYRPLRGKLPVRELQLMGVPPGPKFDQILEKYFEAQLDGKLRGRAQQLRFLRKLAGVPKPKPAPKPKKAKKEAKPAAVAEGRAKPAAPGGVKPAGPPPPAPLLKAVEKPAAEKKPAPVLAKPGRRATRVKRQPKRAAKAKPKKKRRSK